MKSLILLTLLVISVTSFAQNNPNEANMKLLSGQWESIDDKKYEIIISDSIIEYYNKIETDAFSFKVEDNKLTKYSVNGDLYEYEIVGLSKKYLTLMYLQRGNLLKFKKNDR
jgi:hypothetical protein